MSTSYVHLHRFLLKPFLNNFGVVNSVNSFTGRNVFRESFTHVINTFVCPLYPPKTLYHMFFIHICFPHTYQQILTTYPHFVDNIKKSYTRCNYLCVALSKKTYPQICQKDLTSFYPHLISGYNFTSILGFSLSKPTCISRTKTHLSSLKATCSRASITILCIL